MMPSLSPIRTAALCLCVAVATAVAVASRDWRAAPVALMLVGGVAVLLFLTARPRQRPAVPATASADRVAARLVREFEEQGTGWFWQTDSEGHVTYLSAKVAAELDTADTPAIGAPIRSLFRVDTNATETERTIAFHLASRTAFSNYSVRPAVAGKLERWWSMSGRPVSDADGTFQGFIGNGSDLTERRRAEAEIARLASFDSLTGLANRQRMRQWLDQTLSQALGGRGTALFLLDLDRFKAVNDTLGHQTGDALLKQVAQRLVRAIGDSGLVGRLGGDEFEVVLPGITDRDALSGIARTVIESLSQPYSIDGSAITIGCSIGIAIAPEDGADAETMVRNADLALYGAKGDGRGIHRFFKPAMLDGARSRKQIEDDLRQALTSNQFHVAYQPVVSTASERIVGYEALVRWEHPTRGAISPAEFVPVAEDCGLIEAIGEWVLRTACIEAATWPGDVRVAVNVSPIQFANPALPTIVTSALARAGIAAGRLELEITEGVFLDETTASEQMFKTLKAIGVRLALDDFGTGYSSLGYLRKAPFDKIKIDQGFVRGAAIAGNRNAAIIRAIVTLAEALDMETTAEGVETHDEIALIRELGCSHIQGWVYGKAVRAAEVRTHLAAQGGQALASGHRKSRPVRHAMIRTARIRAGAATGEIRIRNMSPSGAMIDGIDIDGDAVGMDVMIELIEDEMFPAKLRWATDGRAGVEFDSAFNMERLGQAAQPARKTG
ncbi:EAL domain-containing protein [Sphingomonas populi]|uniref:EAL domain-containing protein n=1 Tax=Sphingomonas populi TaxID=2484750 RepID=A0A4Q6XWC3_9SPHN|nr:EAL domain-containing protein [Sphingomonas populi]RZF64355.1 EAL domain-containing protein [Sphingomonas populi]